MKKILFTTLLLVITLTTFGQDVGTYGPVPYRSLHQLIGETFVLTKITPDNYGHYRNVKFNDKRLTEKDSSKVLTLVSLDDNKVGTFKDKEGLIYKSEANNYSCFYDLIPTADLEAARKLFLNKTLWLNVSEIHGGNFDVNNSKVIKDLRLEPVTVISIIPGDLHDYPLIFFLKTANGETGYLQTTVSGTNTDLLPERWFYASFFDKDPKLTYHFTPAVWKLIKNGWMEVGMPLDAFILSKGKPTHVNTSKAGSTNRVQLVYGETSPTYYYFINGKYTSTN